MQREQTVFGDVTCRVGCPQAKTIENRGTVGLVLTSEQRVNHGVAGKDDRLSGDSFSQQVFLSTGLGDKQQVGNMIRDDAIYLFGHRSVVRTKSGFYVCQN